MMKQAVKAGTVLYVEKKVILYEFGDAKCHFLWVALSSSCLLPCRIWGNTGSHTNEFYVFFACYKAQLVSKWKQIQRKPIIHNGNLMILIFPFTLLELDFFCFLICSPRGAVLRVVI